VPTEDLARGLVRRCRDAGVDGGCVYDALVGLTTAAAGMTLLTRDERAIPTYERLGIDFNVAG